jgi:hypothetical protein
MAVALGAAILAGRAKEKAAKKAAEVQAAAAGQAITTQREQFQVTQEQFAPFREAGEEALSTLSGFLGLPGGAELPPEEAGAFRRPFTGEDLAEDPGFKFRLETGREALEKSAAARGGLLSGRTGKELTEFGQRLGSQEFESAFQRFRQTQGDLFNRLFGVSEAGRGATTSGAQIGAGTAANIGQAQLFRGQALAGGDIARGEARAGVFTDVSNIIQQQKENALFALTGGMGGSPGGFKLGGSTGTPTSPTSTLPRNPSAFAF